MLYRVSMIFDIRKSRKVGGSIIVPLTGFIEEDKHYRIEKYDDDTVIIRKVKE